MADQVTEPIVRAEPALLGVADPAAAAAATHRACLAARERRRPARRRHGLRPRRTTPAGRRCAARRRVGAAGDRRRRRGQVLGPRRRARADAGRAAAPVVGAPLSLLVELAAAPWAPPMAAGRRRRPAAGRAALGGDRPRRGDRRRSPSRTARAAAPLGILGVPWPAVWDRGRRSGAGCGHRAVGVLHRAACGSSRPRERRASRATACPRARTLGSSSPGSWLSRTSVCGSPAPRDAVRRRGRSRSDAPSATASATLDRRAQLGRLRARPTASSSSIARAASCASATVAAAGSRAPPRRRLAAPTRSGRARPATSARRATGRRTAARRSRPIPSRPGTVPRRSRSTPPASAPRTRSAPAIVRSPPTTPRARRDHAGVGSPARTSAPAFTRRSRASPGALAVTVVPFADRDGADPPRWTAAPQPDRARPRGARAARGRPPARAGDLRAGAGLPPRHGHRRVSPAPATRPDRIVDALRRYLDPLAGGSERRGLAVRRSRPPVGPGRRRAAALGPEATVTGLAAALDDGPPSDCADLPIGPRELVLLGDAVLGVAALPGGGACDELGPRRPRKDLVMVPAPVDGGLEPQLLPARARRSAARSPTASTPTRPSGPTAAPTTPASRSSAPTGRSPRRSPCG